MASELTLKSISPLLTEDVLRQAVRDCYTKSYGTKESPEMVRYLINFASSKGDGYMGVVYRIQVTLDNDMGLSIIGKAMPANLVRRKTFECYMFFANEVFYYNHLVPAFRALQPAHEESLLCIPECYYAISDGNNDFLLMEDLKQTGYDMFARSTGLDINQTNLILKVVAKLHAFSYAMKEKQPENFEKLSSKLTETFYVPSQEKRLSKYFFNLAQLLYRAVKDDLKDTHYLVTYENYIKTPEILFQNLIKSVEVVEPAVITHGDCWSTNFMYQRDTNHVKAIDFQMPRYGSPMIDISSLVFTCLTSQQRDDLGGMSAILATYHRELSLALTQLGAPHCGISLQQLHEHWRRVGVVGFCYALELVPLSLVEQSDVVDLDRVEGEDAILLEDLFKFKDINDAEGKSRLVDLVKLVVDQCMM